MDCRKKNTLIISTSYHQPCSQAEVMPDEVDQTEKDLTLFVRQFEQYYGKNAVTMNVHLLIHMCNAVRNLGPLWAQSTFAFESNNGVIARNITTKTNVLHQMAKKYVLRRDIPAAKKINEVAGVLVQGGVKKIKPYDDEKNVLSKYGILCDMIPIYERIQVRGTSYSCIRYKKTKSADYFIMYRSGQMGIVRFFIKHKKNVFVLIDEHEIITRLNNHVFEMRSSNRLTLESWKNIDCKMIFMTTNNAIGIQKYFCASIPNYLEN